jgi:hypothetical protein
LIGCDTGTAGLRMASCRKNPVTALTIVSMNWVWQMVDSLSFENTGMIQSRRKFRISISRVLDSIKRLGVLAVVSIMVGTIAGNRDRLFILKLFRIKP